MHVFAAESSDWWQAQRVGSSTWRKTGSVTEQDDSKHVIVHGLVITPSIINLLCVFLTWWLLAWMLRGTLILQIQADINEEEKEKGRLFSENKHISDGHCKNKPSYTGVTYIALLASSSCFQHTAPRSLAPTTSQGTTVARRPEFIIRWQ